MDGKAAARASGGRKRQESASFFSDNKIGARLKEIRQSQGLTLNEISSMTAVSVSYLSKMENGLVSPSFDIIKRVSEGLQVSIEDFVRPGEKSMISGRKTVTRESDAIHFTSGQYDYKAHGTELSRKAMVPLEMTVRARSIEEFDHWSRHSGEEFVYVLGGEIDIHTEHYSPFRLKAGESAYFDSSMKHLYVTVGEEDARVLSVSHDPDDCTTERIGQFMNPGTRRVERDFIDPEPKERSRQK